MSDESPSDRDADTTVLDIALSEDDAAGQFDRLADEFALSQDELAEVRDEIMAIVEERTDDDVSAEQKEAMANIMASTIRQEAEQLETPIELMF